MFINILLYAFLAVSIIGTVLTLFKIIKNKKIGGKILKLILIELCFLLYIGLFLLLGEETLATIISVILIMIAIITTQWQKYEDRRMGRRWWTQ